MDPALYLRPPRSLAEVREGMVVARGEVAQVLGAIELPIDLPATAPPAEGIAVAGIDVEFQPFWSRPIRERYERGRSFFLRDATGRALVRVRSRLGDAIDLRLHRPFVQWLDGGRDVLCRTVSVGDEVVVAGSVHFETDVTGQGASSYRDAPTIAVIDPVALFDLPAWLSATAWHALPWYRKLSLIVCNR